MNKIIYFDNAATTWPKPSFVKDKVKDYFQKDVGTINRSNLSDFSVGDLKDSIKKFFNANDNYDVALVPNATIGMNIVINYIKTYKMKVIVSNMEHHSVYRPLNEQNVDYTITESLKSDCTVDENIFINSINNSTGAIIVNHASNVVGSIIDYQYIYNNINNRILKILDASQTAGIEDIDVSTDKIDILVSGCHKHMYGLPGLGIVLYRKDIKLLPLYYGGTGIQSDQMYQPKIYPDLLEVGTPNLLTMMVLEESIRHLTFEKRKIYREYENNLLNYFVKESSNVNDLKVYFCPNKKRTSVVSLNLSNIDPTLIVSKYLEQNNICVRAGLHCAPLVHKAIGTLPHGTIRISFSINNTKEEIDYLILKLNELQKIIY